LPRFEGQLLTDDAALAAAADDFGHMVHRRPTAVLIPGSVDDIIRLVRFARRHALPVAARGQGHSTQGQAQVEAGVSIDMSALATVHTVEATEVLVDGGVRWLDVLHETLPRGLTPPTLTDFLELSVGGTLAVGGIGSQSVRFGPQVEQVRELHVVTGRGELVTCSPTERPALFAAVRAGLGQCGIIVRARLRLIAAPPQVRLYHAFYKSLPVFLADLTHLLNDERFDTVQGFVVPDAAGGWQFQLETTKALVSGQAPDDAALLADLAFTPGTVATQDLPYVAYLNRLEPLVALLKQLGLWAFPHPWVNLFVPAAHATAFVGETLAHLTVEGVGQGPVLLSPLPRARFHAPFLRVPQSPHFFLFALLRNALPPTPERAEALLAANRQLFDQVTRLSGKRYPIDSVPMTPRDWRRHFHPLWDVFRLAKHAYDPDGILTPGQGIFTTR
jgi:FAD/FMN-containing dehydrogenase